MSCHFRIRTKKHVSWWFGLGFPKKSLFWPKCCIRDSRFCNAHRECTVGVLRPLEFCRHCPLGPYPPPIFFWTTSPRIVLAPPFSPTIPGIGTRILSVSSRPLQRVLVLSVRPFPLPPLPIPWLFGDTFRSRISLSCRRLQRVPSPPFPVPSPHPSAPSYPRRTHTRQPLVAVLTVLPCCLELCGGRGRRRGTGNQRSLQNKQTKIRSLFKKRSKAECLIRARLKNSNKKIKAFYLLQTFKSGY